VANDSAAAVADLGSDPHEKCLTIFISISFLLVCGKLHINIRSVKRAEQKSFPFAVYSAERRNRVGMGRLDGTRQFNSMADSRDPCRPSSAAKET
jgi:hypothetical protein